MAVVILVVVVSGAGILVWDERLVMTGQRSAYSITVLRVGLDFLDAPGGMAIFVLMLNASYTGVNRWNFDPALLEASSNAGSVYSASVSGNFSRLLKPATLSPRQSITGQVSFLMLETEKPVKLMYHDQAKAIKFDVLSIPQASNSASRFSMFQSITIQGNGNFTGSIIAYAVVDNDTLTYFAGDVIEVAVNLQYYKQPIDPLRISIVSVTNSDGLAEAKIRPALPVSLVGWGASNGVNVFLVLPATGYDGKIHLLCTVAAPLDG